MKDHECGTRHLRRVIIDLHEKEKNLKMCHDGMDGMHFGRDKTYGMCMIS